VTDFSLAACRGFGCHQVFHREPPFFDWAESWASSRKGLGLGWHLALPRRPPIREESGDASERALARASPRIRGGNREPPGATRRKSRPCRSWIARGAARGLRRDETGGR
jgi:hypothetical protein